MKYQSDVIYFIIIVYFSVPRSFPGLSPLLHFEIGRMSFLVLISSVIQPMNNNAELSIVSRVNIIIMNKSPAS